MSTCVHAISVAGKPYVRCAIGAAINPVPEVCRRCRRHQAGDAAAARAPEEIPSDYDPKQHLHEGGCGCDPPPGVNDEQDAERAG